MNVHTLTVGPLETNGYILEDEGVAVVVDPGAEPERFLEHVEDRRLDVRAILITHGHADHIGAVGELRARWREAPVICHAADADMLIDPELNLSHLAGMELQVGAPDRTVTDGESLTFGPLKLDVRHVPGHTQGHVVFVESTRGVFAGDTLFAGGVGRWDFPGGDGHVLLQAIRSKLLTLPDAMKVYPGHGPATTVGYEKRTNPFLRDGFDPESEDFF